MGEDRRWVDEDCYVDDVGVSSTFCVDGEERKVGRVYSTRGFAG